MNNNFENLNSRENFGLQKNFGLPGRTIGELIEYFKSKPEVEKVLIYGSRAKGNYKTGSDIDFAVWIDDESIKKGIGAYELRIEAELDELETPYMFDVIDYKALTHADIKQSIDRDGKVFYERG